MNKKIISVLLSTILVLSVVFAISGCSKDEDIPADTTTDAAGVVQESGIASDESEVSGENDTTVADKTTDKPNGNKTENGPQQNTPSKNDKESTTVEQTSAANEPVTCDTCGNPIVKDTGKGDIAVGSFCDGQCDEWFGELE